MNKITYSSQHNIQTKHQLNSTQRRKKQRGSHNSSWSFNQRHSTCYTKPIMIELEEKASRISKTNDPFVEILQIFPKSQTPHFLDSNRHSRISRQS